MMSVIISALQKTLYPWVKKYQSGVRTLGLGNDFVSLTLQLLKSL